MNLVPFVLDEAVELRGIVQQVEVELLGITARRVWTYVDVLLEVGYDRIVLIELVGRPLSLQLEHHVVLRPDPDLLNVYEHILDGYFSFV